MTVTSSQLLNVRAVPEKSLDWYLAIRLLINASQLLIRIITKVPCYVNILPKKESSLTLVFVTKRFPFRLILRVWIASQNLSLIK